MEAKNRNLKKQVTKKNQQRCLNSQPFSRNKAYLSKQNCKKNLLSIDYPQFNQFKEQFNPADLQKWNSCTDEFDCDRIQEQIEKVCDVIGSIELNKIRDVQKDRNKRNLLNQRDVEIVNAKSLDVGKRKQKGETKRYKNQIKEDLNGMVRIRSSRNVIKVYNPFPTPFAEMIDHQ